MKAFCPTQKKTGPVMYTDPVVSSGQFQEVGGTGGFSTALKTSRTQLHPLVEPQVVHFMHVPLRTKVKLPHSPQASPS